MRLSKLAFAISAAVLTAGVYAQVQRFGPSDISVGNNDVDPSNPYVDFTLTITPDQQFIQSSPRNRYASFAVRLVYDPTKIELQIARTDGTWLDLSTVPDRTTGFRLQNRGVFFSVQPGLSGTPGLQKLSLGSKVLIELGLGSATNDNLTLSANFFGSRNEDGDFIPMRWWLRGMSPGETYNIETVPPDYAPEDPYGSIIKVISGGNKESPFNAPQGSFFLVPEPASMIALGSGLVGLLALRRRRSN